MRLFSKSDLRSFYFLNATQFLGALNDNVFKLLIVFLLIHVKGPAEASSILSIATAIFVIPFLLFSSAAGVLADRISKSRIIVFTKVLELVIMLFGVLTVWLESEAGCYFALFLMATQSAIFGPSKYGIIPELVDPKKVSKANGSLSSLTFLAIIIGTFLAPFLTDLTDKNFPLEAVFCVFISILGIGTSLALKKTGAEKSNQKINPFFLFEIYQSLKISWKIPHLLPAIYGSSFFLFVGAFTQLNVIPLAMESLNLTDVQGGYLFLPATFGIAIGSLLAGALSKENIEIGISCISGFLIGVCCFLLWIFSFSLTMTIILLFLLGVCGGAFPIPFNAFLQVKSPKEKRGQIIAAAGFFSFIGVLAASFFLYLISVKLGFSAASGFAWVGLLTLISSFFTMGRVASLFFPFFVNKILKRFRTLKLGSKVPDPSTIVILESKSWYDALLLFSCFKKLKILVPNPYMKRFPWINGIFDCVRIVPPEPNLKATLKSLFGEAKRFQGENSSVCLFFHKREDSEPIIQAYRELFEQLNLQVVYAHGKKEKVKKRFLGIDYQEKQITITFSDT